MKEVEEVKEGTADHSAMVQSGEESHGQAVRRRAAPPPPPDGTALSR